METTERTWAAVARARSEQVLRASEERYRALFETIDEGYVTGEGSRDEQGELADYRVLEINPAFAKLNGRPAAEIVGKTVREIAPDVDAIWLETIDQVISTRQPIRLQHIVAGSGKWYDCYFAPAGDHESQRFVAVFIDITERKRASRSASAPASRRKRPCALGTSSFRSPRTSCATPSPPSRRLPSSCNASMAAASWTRGD